MGDESSGVVVGERERRVVVCDVMSLMCCVLAAKCEESGCGRF